MGFLLSALVPAFCEEAIRSSYVYYMADKGRRRIVVTSLAGVFVLGEAIYDLSLFSAARSELGSQLAMALLLIALVTGAALHIGMTFWTAARQRVGAGAWPVFATAVFAHGLFNVIAIALLFALVSTDLSPLNINEIS